MMVNTMGIFQGLSCFTPNPGVKKIWAILSSSPGAIYGWFINRSGEKSTVGSLDMWDLGKFHHGLTRTETHRWWLARGIIPKWPNYSGQWNIVIYPDMWDIGGIWTGHKTTMDILGRDCFGPAMSQKKMVAQTCPCGQYGQCFMHLPSGTLVN